MFFFSSQDSFRFLPGSLSKLVETLKTKTKPGTCLECKEDLECNNCSAKLPPKDVFCRTHAYVQETFGEQHFDLLLSKQVYPYSYINSYAKLEEKCLPPPEAFYDKLNAQPVSPEAYQHAQRVWNELGCKTLGDFSAVYLSLDVLLLG